MYDKQAATEYVARAIEANGTDVASRGDFDITAIVDELYIMAGGSWDVSRVDDDVFWQTVERHAR